MTEPPRNLFFLQSWQPLETGKNWQQTRSVLNRIKFYVLTIEVYVKIQPSMICEKIKTLYLR